METAWSWVDIIIVATLGLSILVGLGRGVLRTAVSLITWGAAFYFAYKLGPSASEQLKPYLASDELRIWLVRLAIFILVVLLGAIVGNILGNRTNKGIIDRVLGLVLGAVLGAFIVATAILLSGLTNFPETSLFKTSQLIPYFMDLVAWIKGFLPLDIQREIILQPTGAT